jgi:hypothetical protein
MLAIGCGLLAGYAFAEEEPSLIEARLFNGLTHRGMVLRENDDVLTVLTSTGEKELARREIVLFKRQFSAEERAAILVLLPRQGTSRGEVVAPRLPKLTFEIGRVVEDGGSPALRAPVLVTGRQMDWPLQMAVGMNRRLSLEFTDTNLDEAVNFIASVTRLNIIVDPKVRGKNLKVSLSVKDMDAGTVLKWVARLTETYIDVVNQALYITDKPGPEVDDEERAEALMLIARVGADAAVMPPEGQALTNEDRIRIAMAIWEKENPTPTDFPAPELRLDRDSFLNPSNLIAPGR